MHNNELRRGEQLLELKVFQKGFNYSQDGDGNRLVYHLQGCNIHCPWCANPEGIAIDGILMVQKDYLIDAICPLGAITHKALNRQLCKTCLTYDCVQKHRTKGIRRSYETYSVDELVEEAKRSEILFYDGGGVTLSGGEATVQFEGVKMLLSKLKAKGIHTAIETNGTHSNLSELFGVIDLLMIDFKHYDDNMHQKVTGISNKIIIRNIEKALNNHPRVHIRVPLIGGFNTDEKDAAGFAAFFKKYSSQKAVFEFLPYHEYGKAKWEQCGLNYKVTNGAVDEGTIALFEHLFIANNLSVIHT